MNGHAGTAAASILRTGHLPLRLCVLVAALLVCFGYFYPGGGWSQNSRIDLARAIVEEQTFAIDSFHTNTGDKAYVNGHYYTDKAPGLSLMAVPAWALARQTARAIGKDPDSVRSLNVAFHLTTIAVVGLPTALAAACLFLLALYFGSSIGGAAVASVAFGIATPIWAYATLFWSHATAASFLLFAFAAAMALPYTRSARTASAVAVILGLTAGWTVVVEYSAAVPAAMLVIVGLWNCRPMDRRRFLTVAGGVGIAILVCAGVLGVYTANAFNSPFDVGYSYTVNFQDEFAAGTMGFRLPQPEAVRQIIVGWYRGLLNLSPFLVFAPFGVYLMWRSGAPPPVTLLLATIPLYYLVVASSFIAWHAGSTFGPRYLAPALPFLCLPVAVVWSRFGTRGRMLLGGLVAYGAMVSIVAVSTTPMPPFAVQRPIQDFLWPAFREGRIPASHPLNSWNVGGMAGLSGYTSLVPLLVACATAFAAWMKLQQSEPRLATTAHGHAKTA